MSLPVLYQAEWCPHSQRVRERLTELGLDFVARQVPPEPEDRALMRRATGFDEIPVLVLGDGTVVGGDDAILHELSSRFPEPVEAAAHRSKALEAAT